MNRGAIPYASPFRYNALKRYREPSMTVKHLNAKKDWAKYLKRRVQIVELYNQHSKAHFEEPQLDYNQLQAPELLHVFFDSDVKGGVLVEQLVGNEDMALITFAAVESERRNEGVGTRLVEYATETLASKGIALVGVQINDFDDRAFWIKRGFPEAVPHQGITVMLREGM